MRFEGMSEIQGTIYPDLVSTVWSRTTKANIHKLKLLQNFAARFQRILKKNLSYFTYTEWTRLAQHWWTSKLVWRNYDLQNVQTVHSNLYKI